MIVPCRDSRTFDHSGYHSSVFAGNRLIRFILAMTPGDQLFAILFVHSKQIRPAPSHTTIVQSPCLRILLRFTLSIRSSWNTSETNLRPSAGIFLHPRSARQRLSLNAYLTWACRGVNHLLPPSITLPCPLPPLNRRSPLCFRIIPHCEAFSDHDQLRLTPTFQSHLAAHWLTAPLLLFRNASDTSL